MQTRTDLPDKCRTAPLTGRRPDPQCTISPCFAHIQFPIPSPATPSFRIALSATISSGRKR